VATVRTVVVDDDWVPVPDTVAGAPVTETAVGNDDRDWGCDDVDD